MSSNIESLVKDAPEPEELARVLPLPAFAEQTLSFVDSLSVSLMRTPEARQHPELTALAFWMRRSNLVRLQRSVRDAAGERLLVARGTAFHIAPSNVDTIFVYSWFLSLLCGNRNIVRLSSKRSAQGDVLVKSIATLLTKPEHSEIACRNLLIRYSADDEISARLSLLCDVRVIWGGDETVKHIRTLPLPSTSIDLAFANKYSLALINSGRWLVTDIGERERQVQLFWNDAYWFDQMACSSPRLVLWVGEQSREAADDFWQRLDNLIIAKGTRFADADYVNKLMAVDSLAIDTNAVIRTGTNNALVLVHLAEPGLHVGHHCGAGLFFTSAVPTLDGLRPLLNRTVQTVCYFGWSRDELREFVSAKPLCGIDRIVPLGSALDFSPIWDGFDLTQAFMREITVS